MLLYPSSSDSIEIHQPFCRRFINIIFGWSYLSFHSFPAFLPVCVSHSLLHRTELNIIDCFRRFSRPKLCFLWAMQTQWSQLCVRWGKCKIFSWNFFWQYFHCQTSADKSTCVCSEGFFQQQSSESGVSCSVSLASETYTDDLATLAGLGIGLSVLTIFICFTLKLFSKARNTETRGYGDASIPPTIMVEGKDVSTADVETCSRTSSKSRIYTPGPPLTPSQVRRMSELSTLSVTVGERDFKMRPVSPNTSGPGSLDMLFEEGKGNVNIIVLINQRWSDLSRWERGAAVDHHSQGWILLQEKKSGESCFPWVASEGKILFSSSNVWRAVLNNI